MPSPIPTYDELPVKSGNPPRSAWGLWGDDDQIGTINWLTAERVVAGARLVKKGAVFALNWELEKPTTPLFFRETLRHTIKHRGHTGHDDVFDNWNTQASTQWDGLTHVGHPQYGFYNGVRDEQITGQAGTLNGIEHWARRGLAGRGVLVDFARWAKANGVAAAPHTNYKITVAQFTEAARSQGVQFQMGDVLLFRTGWMEWYNTLTPRERFELGHSMNFQCIGLEQSDETLRFLWDNHFAAVASDNTSIEAWPPDPQFGFLHQTLLPLFGLPLGEMFNLEALAADCAADAVYEFFFTSAPLNKLGGVASPPNALAIK
jgi:kynurenine formamidase